jgi:hypothetical protein
VGVARTLGEWVALTALTAVVCLIAWRLSVALTSSLVLCAMFCLPAALSMRSMSKAMASFFAVLLVGDYLLATYGPTTRLSFLLVGLSVASAVLYVTVGAGEKLAEARRALGIVRSRASTMQDAIQRAGVCLVVVGRNMTWASVNEAAWMAFGSDARLRRGMDARVELDDEAAAALMHSGSRESWRAFHEAVSADSAREKLQPGQTLPPYQVTLYDIAGRATTYRFVVSMGSREEMVFVGFPEAAGAAPESADDLEPEKWFQAAVSTFDEPSVVVQSDGFILAANESFSGLCGGGDPLYVFDCVGIRGLSERTFAASVWIPTRSGARDLPSVTLDGAGQAIAARIAPPKAAYTEAVLIMFREQGHPVPPGFAEATRPMPL